MKIKTIAIVLVLMVMSLNSAYASISPNYLPQIQVTFDESSDLIKVGKDEYGGITFVMPNGHKDMVVTFYWEQGGVVDFLFYDYSDNLVWDSHDDAPFYSPKKYALYNEKPIRTYEVGSNVSKIVAYCSYSDKVCTTNSSVGVGATLGTEIKGSYNVSYGKSCTESYYYAALRYGNVREK